MTTRLPLKVTGFPNASGSVSYRVTGMLNGERIRKNFADRAQAEVFCNANNSTVLELADVGNLRISQTRLSEEDLRSAETIIDRAAGRWSLKEIGEAGLHALESAPEALAVAPLFEEWLAIFEQEASPRWLAQVRINCRAFLRSCPGLATDGLTRATVRQWLDGQKEWSQQSKRNARNALHRWGGWLVERGACKENPASLIKIGKAGPRQAMPAVFTPVQAEAYMHALEMPECRRMKGWGALCLFAGLRPNSEALRLSWDEINLETEEINVLGTKRGMMPRVIRLQPAAVTWLRIVRSEGETTPGFYSRTMFRRSVEIANSLLLPSDHFRWENDLTRHSYGSYVAGLGVSVADLAEMMGNSPKTIYSYYRNPRNASQVKAFWAIRPSL